tara:strand:- start:5349 stop:6098 length:750 start_codon:yes stop_codon:yes gene_type:complete
MIDYLTVIYKNYDLLYLQLDNFKKRFSDKDYRLIVVDNTPDIEKKKIERKDEIDIVIEMESLPNTFDGISHGGAIDASLAYCESDIVCIFDSDFFFLDENLNSYVKEKFASGYVAVGTEWDDGDGTRPWFKKFPERYENIPCAFGSFYNLDLAKSESWIVTQQEVNQNQSSGFIEMGWRIRENILENKLKTFAWKLSPISDNNKFSGYGNCFFVNEYDKIAGVHYGAGSHRRWNCNTNLEIQKLLDGDY